MWALQRPQVQFVSSYGHVAIDPLFTHHTVYNLSAYLPDALVPQFEALRDQLLSVLGVLGLANPVADAGAGM